MKSFIVRLSFFLFFSIAGCVLDLWTKNLAFANLGLPGEQPPSWVIEGVFGFQTSLNQGALFGIGQGQIFLFVTRSFIALIGICWWMLFGKERNIFISIVLGLVLAGILGNLWDRSALHGMMWTQYGVYTGQCEAGQVGSPVYAVRDWILVMIGSYHWPNFNLADSFLVTGAILMTGYILIFTDTKPADNAGSADNPSSP